MTNGLGGLLVGLLGIAILANVAANIIGKGATGLWDGVKEVKHKVPKGEVNFWW